MIGSKFMIYKSSDRAGMHMTGIAQRAGTVTFRYDDYRLNGLRETLTFARYGPDSISLGNGARATAGRAKSRSQGHLARV